MSNTKRIQLKITVPDLPTRLAWETLEDLPWPPEVIFEIVMRYCDTQDHAKNYRKRSALKTQLLKARLDQLAKASGMSVEAYLEMEESNLS